jgi:hypothetical protein
MRHRHGLLLLLVGLGATAPLARPAQAQIERYDAQLEGSFCLLCNLGTGEGSTTISHLDLTNVEIDTAERRLSFEVGPGSPVGPDEVVAFARGLGYSIVQLEVRASGAPRHSEAGWFFALPNGELYPLDPAGHEPALLGDGPTRVRATLEPLDGGGWRMTLVDVLVLP